MGWKVFGLISLYHMYKAFPLFRFFFSTGNRIIRHHWHLHLVLITITRIHNTFCCCRNAQCQCSSFTMLFHWGGFPCMCTASLSYWPRRCSGCHLVAVTVNWSILFEILASCRFVVAFMAILSHTRICICVRACRTSKRKQLISQFRVCSSFSVLSLALAGIIIVYLHLFSKCYQWWSWAVLSTLMFRHDCVMSYHVYVRVCVHAYICMHGYSILETTKQYVQESKCNFTFPNSYVILLLWE